MRKKTIFKALYDKSRSLKAILYKGYGRLLKLRGHPREIALGFALGIFIGMSPFMGVQTAIAVSLASIFKWNKISSAIGVWITNPVTAPIVYSITYLIGGKLLGIGKSEKIIEGLDASRILAMLSKAPEIIWALIIGGIITGIPLAVFSYYFSYSAVRKYQDDIKLKLAQKKEEKAQKKKEKKMKRALK
ncbi:MAG: DUF2062 domain-containing protein [Desulfobacteraceae bacterium]|nr:DUF2062 domain-containing protein [Desulfobacteraceae bacterium]